MLARRFRVPTASLAVALSLSCSPATPIEEIVFQNPVSDLTGVLTQSGVEFDGRTTSDGTGSLKIHVTEPATIRLYEAGDVDVENARLLYRARIRTEGVQGRVYLEMWCHFPGQGEFFSRALHAPLTGTTDWTSQETPFFLEENQNPDQIKLNIVIDGRGTVWVDDVVLVRASR